MGDELIWLRPPPTGRGRPAQRGRGEITAAAIAVADAEGLAAVSMRRVAQELGTAAASLYRYVDTRDDLLDLMADDVCAEYRFDTAPGEWLAGLIDIAVQMRDICRRHPWLPDLVLTRPVTGPHGIVVLERAFEVLAGHPADADTKLIAWSTLNALVVTAAKAEASTVDQLRSARYVQHAVAQGGFPHLANLQLATPEPNADVLVEQILPRLLHGLLD